MGRSRTAQAPNEGPASIPTGPELRSRQGAVLKASRGAFCRTRAHATYLGAVVTGYCSVDAASLSLAHRERHSPPSPVYLPERTARAAGLSPHWPLPPHALPGSYSVTASGSNFGALP